MTITQLALIWALLTFFGGIFAMVVTRLARRRKKELDRQAYEDELRALEEKNQ